MCRKSIFVSFRNERLRMTTHWPRYIYREEIMRRAWWLNIILVVVWRRWLGGILAQSKCENQNPETPDKRLCNAAREESSCVCVIFRTSRRSKIKIYWDMKKKHISPLSGHVRDACVALHVSVVCQPFSDLFAPPSQTTACT